MSRRPSAPRPRAVHLATLVALILAACTPACGGDGSPRPRPTITEDKGAAALDKAIDGLNASRAALLTDTSAIIAAAKALDTGDAAAAVGDRPEMQRLRKDIEPKQSAAVTAVRRRDARLAAYASALTALDTASAAPALDTGQRAAVSEVVRAGRAEHAVLTTFARVAAGVWPHYLVLHENETLWHTRSRGGWYRDTQEAANAYAVLVSDERVALDRARRLLQKADSDRARAVAATSAAITAARTALVDLVDASG